MLREVGGLQTGATFPALWDRVALPPPGSKPVRLRSVSPRAARKLESFKEEMLKENVDECVDNCEVRNYGDPHFRWRKNMLQLSCLMAMAGMICRTAEKVDEVGLFWVVKNGDLLDGELDLSLRLVFDQRRSNMRWRAPPWCAIGASVRCRSWTCPRR